MPIMLKTAILSDVNLNSLKFALRKEYSLFLPSGYGSWEQELLNRDSDFYKFNADFAFIILHNNDGEFSSESNFSIIEQAASALPNCRFFVSDLKAGKNKIHKFPLKEIVFKFGELNVYSPKMWYLSSNPFSALGEKQIAKKMIQLTRPAKIASKKCLILDLDNTLWGGVIGEDGVNGIKLDNHGEGGIFYDFQKRVLDIRKRGILLAAASKNNPQDAENAFSHPFMLLKKEDFSVILADWQPKSESIKQIARALNIGEDSLVFVDDSPLEREEVRRNCPQVLVADFPEDTSFLPQLADDLYDDYFYSWNLTEEDLQKTQMYAENAKREEIKKAFASLDDFLKDLNICLQTQKVDSKTLPRAFQMLQKTNQFNLTAKKHSEAVLAQMVEDTSFLVLIGSVKDKFGDNGLSILGIARQISEHEAEIDSFLMSCRIMGRRIEFDFLKEMEMLLVHRGIDKIYANYIPTEKNAPAANFYKDAGYEKIQNGNKYFKSI